MYVILTHDVDWPLHGPGRKHVLERLDRFDESVRRRILYEGFNPYFGIPFVIEAEERVGVKSTFFFRPVYDDGTLVDCYAEVLKELVKSGWEVGVHLNSTESLERVKLEKRLVEETAGARVVGARVHYLRIRREDYRNLHQAGILYDSSIKKLKDRIEIDDTGYTVIHGVIVFPITIMDAYLFTYMKLSEDKVLSTVLDSLLKLKEKGVEYVTILWHDNAILMKGGRLYPKIIEELASIEDIDLIKGVDAYKTVVKQEQEYWRRGEGSNLRPPG